MAAIGLEPSGYGNHLLRRTKAAEIYSKTGNLRAVLLLLGHTKVDSTVKYLGIELEDALSIADAYRHLNHVGGRYLLFANSDQTYVRAAAVV